MLAKRAALRWSSAVMLAALGACAPARWMSPEDGRGRAPVRVAVLGEVEHPGWLTCPPGCDLGKAVDLVGGPTEFARSVALRRRQADGQWETEWFRLDEPGRSHRRTPLAPGDIVMIGSTL